MKHQSNVTETRSQNSPCGFLGVVVTGLSTNIFCFLMIQAYDMKKCLGLITYLKIWRTTHHPLGYCLIFGPVTNSSVDHSNSIRVRSPVSLYM